MGVFEMTCPLSGVPIKANDPVRWALITDTNSFENPPVYVCEAYAFVTPLLRGTYNSYGSVEWNESKIWQWLWSKIYPGIKPRKDKPEIAFNGSHENVFNELISGRQTYDPNRDKKWSHSACDMQIWMCHEEAFRTLVWNSLLTDDYDLEILEHINNWSQPRYFSILEHIPQTRPQEWKVEGDQGVFIKGFTKDLFVCKLMGNKIVEGYEEHRAEFIELVKETCVLVYKMRKLRKVLQPVLYGGAQYDDCEAIADWSEWVAKFARKKRNDYLKEQE